MTFVRPSVGVALCTYNGARYLQAQQKNTPAADAMRAAIQGPPPDLSGGYRYLKLDRMAYYVHKDTYRAAVRAASVSLADTDA